MGKKLIIKGADFSANGIHEEVLTLDKSALYTYNSAQMGTNGELVTADNLSQLVQADTSGYKAAGVNGLASNIHNSPTLRMFAAVFEVGDYDTLKVNMVSMPYQTITGGAVTSYMFGIGFANENTRIIKAYGPTESEATGDWYVKVAANFNGEIPIPDGTHYIYITDIIENTAALEAHSVVLKKTVVD